LQKISRRGKKKIDLPILAGKRMGKRTASGFVTRGGFLGGGRRFCWGGGSVCVFASQKADGGRVLGKVCLEHKQLKKAKNTTGKKKKKEGRVGKVTKT